MSQDNVEIIAAHLGILKALVEATRQCWSETQT
jgi:hypothetical protein